MNIQALSFAGQTSLPIKNKPIKNNVEIEEKPMRNMGLPEDPFQYEKARAISASVQIVKKEAPEKLESSECYVCKSIPTSMGDVSFGEALGVFSTILYPKRHGFTDTHKFVKLSRPLSEDPVLASQFVDYERKSCVNLELLFKIDLYKMENSDIKPGVLTMLDSIASEKVNALSDEALVDILQHGRFIALKTLNTFTPEQIKMLSNYEIPECKAFFQKMIDGMIHIEE